MVEEAGRAREAVLAARRELPDILVLDINLKEASGLEVLERLRLEWPGLRVVMFSIYADVVYATMARRLGALGFVSKSAEAEELIKAVRHASRGKHYIDQETSAAIAAASTTSDSAEAHLSNRELDILRLFAKGKSLIGIADTLGIAYKIIANQCTNIKEKLCLDRTADLVRYALENRSSSGAL